MFVSCKPYVTLLLVRSLLTKQILSCLNTYTSDFLQMTLSMQRGPVFWNSISSECICKDLTCQMKCYIRLQCSCQLRKNSHVMMLILGQMGFLTNSYKKSPLSSSFDSLIYSYAYLYLNASKNKTGSLINI